MNRRRDPHSWTVVRLPERDLAEVVLEVADPLLAMLGPEPGLDEARAAIELTVELWNASVRASKRWERPRLKELRELKKSMRGRGARPEDREKFDALAGAWRKHWLDPRIVESWSYDMDADGVCRLECAMALPDGVEAEAPPPVEKRIAIGGRLLDEVRIKTGADTALGFPVERHRGVIDDEGTVTVYAMMPTALQLFAEGVLPRVGSDPVDVVVGGRELGPLQLAAVRCGGGQRNDVAVLVFETPVTSVG